MTLLIEVLALLADIVHHILPFFSSGDSLRGNWSATFTSPAGGECIELYRLAEFRRAMYVFIQQYKRAENRRESRQAFVGRGVRHGDLMYCYYNTVDSDDDRAGVMVLQRVHEPDAALEKRVRAQYWETYPTPGALRDIEAEIQMKKQKLTFRQKLDITRSKFLFESFDHAKEVLSGKSSSLHLEA